MTFAHAIQRIAVLLAIVVLAGCASGAKPIAMVPIDAQTASSDNRFFTAVKVASVTGGEETSPLWTSEISSADFRLALDTALAQTKFANAAGDLSLFVELLEIDQPLIGFALTVTSTVRYTLRDANRTILFDETVQAPHTAQFSDSILGVERLRLANEGSARANIKEFIRLLEIEGRVSSNDAATS